MATYRDPIRCFAPLEVVERLLEIRAEAGYLPAIFLLSPDDLAASLDACGFDVYSFRGPESEIHFGDIAVRWPRAATTPIAGRERIRACRPRALRVLRPQ